MLIKMRQQFFQSHDTTVVRPANIDSEGLIINYYGGAFDGIRGNNWDYNKHDILWTNDTLDSDLLGSGTVRRHNQFRRKAFLNC